MLVSREAGRVQTPEPSIRCFGAQAVAKSSRDWPVQNPECTLCQLRTPSLPELRCVCEVALVPVATNDAAVVLVACEIAVVTVRLVVVLSEMVLVVAAALHLCRCRRDCSRSVRVSCCASSSSVFSAFAHPVCCQWRHLNPPRPPLLCRCSPSVALASCAFDTPSSGQDPHHVSPPPRLLLSRCCFSDVFVSAVDTPFWGPAHHPAVDSRTPTAGSYHWTRAQLSLLCWHSVATHLPRQPQLAVSPRTHLRLPLTKPVHL
mmetsp:Transcript_51409/g.137203  ORF Transcript_51409/g.137203 Transcript_51409/m.137203 type:complete len:260 (-) Transcript_51409:1034-1813(-)